LKGKDLKTDEDIRNETATGGTNGSFIPDIVDKLEEVNK
jgi:hypothetical protein